MSACSFVTSRLPVDVMFLPECVRALSTGAAAALCSRHIAV